MRLFAADTVALVSFFTLAGALNEWLVAGMAWNEIALARLVAVPTMLVTARPYGLWRDLVLSRLAGPEPRLGRLVVLDTAALLSFQIPLYAVILWTGGANLPEILRGCAGAAVIMLVAGRPYGLWLEWVRARFGVSSSVA